MEVSHRADRQTHEGTGASQRVRKPRVPANVYLGAGQHQRGQRGRPKATSLLP